MLGHTALKLSLLLTGLGLCACNEGSPSPEPSGASTQSGAAANISTTASGSATSSLQTTSNGSSTGTSSVPSSVAPARWSDMVRGAAQWSTAQAAYAKRTGQSEGPVDIVIVLGQGDPCAILQEPSGPRVEDGTWEMTIRTQSSTGIQPANLDVHRNWVQRQGLGLSGQNPTVEFLTFDQTGSPGKLRVTASLPLDPGFTRDCGSTKSPDGTSFGHCNCYDGDLQTFGCDPIAQGYDCCLRHTKGGAYHQLSFEIANVTYCPPKP